MRTSHPIYESHPSCRCGLYAVGRRIRGWLFSGIDGETRCPDCLELEKSVAQRMKSKNKIRATI